MTPHAGQGKHHFMHIAAVIPHATNHCPTKAVVQGVREYKKTQETLALLKILAPEE